MSMIKARGYSRAQLLDRASRALKRGRRSRALKLYSRVLEHEPENFELHRRIAPLLADSGRVEDALASYRVAAGALTRRGFLDHAVGVYREAAQRLPRQREIWEALSELEVKRGKPADAQRALLEGARKLRGRSQLPDVVVLLIRARKLNPRHFETSFALARALVKGHARRHAASVLTDMARWTRGRELRRVRARQLLLAPGPGAAWQWLVALASR